MRKITTLSVLLLALVALVFATAEAGGKDRSAKARTPKEEALVALGRRLFFDPVVSRSAARSCASCHDPEHGFADPLRVSDDDIGRTRRHSQTLIDSHRNPTAHWDGEFETIEELVLARIGAIKGRRGKLGHGTTLLDAVAQEVGGEDLEELFGDPETDLGEEEVDDDVIDDGDDPAGGNDDENPYAGDGDVRREPGTASPKGSAKSAGASRPTTPTTPSAPSAPRAKAPAGAAPAAPAPKADAPKEAAPEAKPDVKEPKAKAAAAKAKAKADETKPTAAELKRRADALRESLRTLPVAHDVLELGARYDEAFAAAFGNRKVNAQRIARAIAAYCRSLESTTAPYDRYMAGDADALSAAAKRGLALFRGRAGCAQCHTMDGEHPAFTDFDFHNTGVVWNRLTSKQRAIVARHDETFRRKRDDLEMPKGPDEGRARVSTRRDDLRAFKTPTLRDASRRGPYMHDGRFKTLTDVVSYYARGASPDPAKTSHVKAFEAGAQDIDDLVAFLESLTGDTRPGLPTAAWRERAAKTRLQFVDADGKPLVGLTVALRPVGDRAYATASIHKEPGARRTDDHGWIEFTQRRTIHTQLVLPGGLTPVGGALVPDSCKKAKIVVPVRGRTALVVHFAAGVQAPATLAAEHLGTVVLPGHQVPRTRLERGEVLDLGRSQVVRYEGWLRTDVPSEVRVRIPGQSAATAQVTLAGDEAARIDLTTK